MVTSYLLKTQNCAFAIAVRCMVVARKSFFVINSFLSQNPLSTLKKAIHKILWKKKYVPFTVRVF